jgi:Fe-S-cluster-containing dehydrogenase component/DMSO reductase anchor subunit
MQNGFIFDHNKCVNCNACNAACVLENGWTVHPRNIFTYNSEAENILPVINLSLACNHCQSAVCMQGCPASVFSRGEDTGAILFDEKKCIGCKYCQWNCPYDAPKFDYIKKTIAKCNLCNSGLVAGRLPACSTACPTGALRFGQLTDIGIERDYSWFPDKKLIPAIAFTGHKNVIPLKIIPEITESSVKPDNIKKGRDTSGDLSLIIFSFFATISVALLISSFISEIYPDKWFFISLLLSTGLVSFFHLGKKFRSWRSISNLRYSPLSREIAVFILYSGISSITVFLNQPSFLIVSAFTGLILLLLIDNVYIYADRSKSTFLHSGQAFISALLIVSFLCSTVLPFLIMAIIKLALTIYGLTGEKLGNSFFVVRFLRIVLLVVPGLNLVLQRSHPDITIIIIFLAGELLDRVLFYVDFNPLNINSLITKQVNSDRDEKKNNK